MPVAINDLIKRRCGLAMVAAMVAAVSLGGTSRLAHAQHHHHGGGGIGPGAAVGLGWVRSRLGPRSARERMVTRIGMGMHLRRPITIRRRPTIPPCRGAAGAPITAAITRADLNVRPKSMAQGIDRHVRAAAGR
jgi:hypothetical protein